LSGNIDEYWVNDTADFYINPINGILENITKLNKKKYYLEIQCNDSYGNDKSDFMWVNVVDTVPPEFSQIPQNKTLSFDQSLYLDLNATDNYLFDSFYINDTTDFKINSGTGVFENKTNLLSKIYFVKVYINDSSNNTNIAWFKVTVQQNPPNAPLFVSPANESTATDSPVELRCDKNASALMQMKFWVGNDTSNLLLVHTGLEEKFNVSVLNTLTYYWRCGNYNATTGLETNASGYYWFGVSTGGGLTLEEHEWLETIYEEVGNMNLTLIYVFFLVVSTVFLGMYAFKRDRPREEGSRGFILGTIAWFLFLGLTFISFHLEIDWLRIPSAWLFGGISLIIGISLFVDVWASWKKI